MLIALEWLTNENKYDIKKSIHMKVVVIYLNYKFILVRIEKKERETENSNI